MKAKVPNQKNDEDDYKIRVEDIAHLDNIDTGPTYMNTTDIQRLVSSVKSKKKSSPPTSTDVLKLNPPINNQVSVIHTTTHLPISHPGQNKKNNSSNQALPVIPSAGNINNEFNNSDQMKTVVTRSAPPPPVPMLKQTMSSEEIKTNPTINSSEKIRASTMKSKSRISPPKEAPPCPPELPKPAVVLNGPKKPARVDPKVNSPFVVLKPISKEISSSREMLVSEDEDNEKPTIKPLLPTLPKPKPSEISKPEVPSVPKPKILLPPKIEDPSNSPLLNSKPNPPTASKPSLSQNTKPNPPPVMNKPKPPPILLTTSSETSLTSKIGPDVLPKPRKSPKSPLLPPLKIGLTPGLKIGSSFDSACSTPDTALTCIDTPDTGGSTMSISARKALLEGKFQGMSPVTHPNLR